MCRLRIFFWKIFSLVEAEIDGDQEIRLGSLALSYNTFISQLIGRVCNRGIMDHVMYEINPVGDFSDCIFSSPLVEKHLFEIQNLAGIVDSGWTTYMHRCWWARRNKWR